MRTRWIIASLVTLELALALSPMQQLRSMRSRRTPDAASTTQKATEPLVRPSALAPTSTPRPAPARVQPFVETPEVLDSMTRAELESSIAELDAELERTRAIERLNAETVTAEERLELGALLQRGALMRNRIMQLDLDELARAVDQYAANHEARVAQYVYRRNP